MSAGLIIRSNAMLRIVITVIKFLIKQILEVKNQDEVDKIFEDLKAKKQILYEAW